MDAVADTNPPAPMAALELSAGPRAERRDLTYSDQVAELFPSRKYPKLAPLHQPAAPAAFAGFELFPGALLARGAARLFGLVGSYERGFATSVLFAEGTAYERRLSTRSSATFLGLKGRLPLGAHELSLTVGYGSYSYELLGDEAAPVVPDVAYRYVQLDAAARFGFGAPFARLHGGTRFVSSSGALGSEWFPGAKTNCVEAGLAAGYAPWRAVELELGLDFVRYGFDFNPVAQSTDPWTRPVAGGAVDQYLSLSLALRYRFDAAPATASSQVASRGSR